MRPRVGAGGDRLQRPPVARAPRDVRQRRLGLGALGAQQLVIQAEEHIAGLHPLLANCLRLTVGTPQENTLMLDALKASL